jgi:hypothetical protein
LTDKDGIISEASYAADCYREFERVALKLIKEAVAEGDFSAEKIHALALRLSLIEGAPANVIGIIQDFASSVAGSGR